MRIVRASQVGAEQIVAAWDDKDGLRQLAEQADFITFETEHFDVTALIPSLTSIHSQRPSG